MSCGRDAQEMCRCSIEGDKPLSLAVIECISLVDGGNPDTHPPLHDAIDPDALNNLFRDRESGEVTFSYLDYEVTVTGDAVVTRPSESQPVGAD